MVLSIISSVMAGIMLFDLIPTGIHESYYRRSEEQQFVLQTPQRRSYVSFIFPAAHPSEKLSDRRPRRQTRPETCQWRPFWLKMIGLSDTNFTLLAPMTFGGLQGSYIFDLIKVAPGSQKVAPGSHKIPVNWEPLLRKSGSQFPTSYFFPFGTSLPKKVTCVGNVHGLIQLYLFI